MRTFAVAAALVLPLTACFLHPSSGGAPITSTPGADAAALNKAGVGSKAPADEPGVLRPLSVEATRRFEYVDLYVSMGDPVGQRKLAPYILKGEIWTLDKFENVTDTLRHYRFRRMVGTDGKAMPDLDPLSPRP